MVKPIQRFPQFILLLQVPRGIPAATNLLGAAWDGASLMGLGQKAWLLIRHPQPMHLCTVGRASAPLPPLSPLLGWSPSSLLSPPLVGTW